MRAGKKVAEQTLSELRLGIREINSELVHLLGRRLRLVLEIGKLKQGLKVPIIDPAREKAVICLAGDKRQVRSRREKPRRQLYHVIACGYCISRGESRFYSKNGDLSNSLERPSVTPNDESRIGRTKL